MRVATIRNLRLGPRFSIQNDNNAVVCDRSLILNQLPGKLGFHLVLGTVNHGQSHLASVLAAASAARLEFKATWKFVMKWKIYGGGTKPADGEFAGPKAASLPSVVALCLFAWVGGGWGYIQEVSFALAGIQPNRLL